MQQLRNEYLATVAKVADESLRATFLLLLSVMDEVSRKIDNVLSDDKGLRAMVLNGLSETHVDDHKWIAQQRASGCSIACEWAKEKMEEEEADKARAEDRVRKVVDKVLEHAVTVLLTGLAIYFGFLR